jgi:tRNA(fMet)-specific endonuclease VapC
MIRYLLDTNIVSYFLKGINNGLITRMELGFKAQNIAISAVTRAELQHPALRAYCRPEA